MLEQKGRSYQSIKNAKVGLIVYVFDLLLIFFGRKLFIDILGPELLGLNTISQSILRFLNLAELGISAAVGYSLYKPLFNKDKEQICEIISLQGYLYRKIAYFMAISSFVLLAFFPLIFQNSGLPTYYAYASYLVLLFSVLLGYVVNYRQVIFTADQKNYICIYLFQGGRVVKNTLQILVLLCFSPEYSFWIWLSMEVLVAILSSVGLEVFTKKYYPFLKTNLRLGKYLMHKYADIKKSIFQLFFHRLGGLALAQSSPIIIYAYASLKDVTVFENYNFIVLGIIVMLENIFNGMISSIGSLAVEKTQKELSGIYWELFSFRTFLCGVIMACTIFLSQSFIALWLGSDYVMPNLALIFLMASFFIRIFRGATDAFINAFGLYKDIYAPIAEAVLNIGLSVLFGYYWGLTGIMAGVFCSLFIVIFIWKPIFLFRERMQESVSVYFYKMLKHISLLFVAVFSTYMLRHFIPFEPSKDFISWLLYGICIALICSSLCFGLYYAFIPSMRSFTNRLKTILFKR